MTRKRTGLVVAIASLLVLTAVPASAQDYPPEAATCAVSVTTPALGEAIEVECSGWMPNGEVDVSIFSQHRHLGTLQVDANGEVTGTVTIPSDLAPGDHTLRFSGINAQGEQQHVDIALTVQEAGGPGLAATGMNSGTGVGLGVGLLGAGAAAVYVARRRQATQPA